MRFVISAFWKRSTDYRSFLYYSYLLHIKYGATPRHELHSFRSELEKYTTIQDRFEPIVNALATAGIIIDPQKLHLNPAAIAELERIFEETFGTGDPKLLRFNGLEIYEASAEKRYQDWVVRGTEELESIFRDAEISVSYKSNGTSYRFAQVHTTPDRPFLVWGFYNLSRLEDLNDCMSLILAFRREQTRRTTAVRQQIDGYSVDGALGSAILAAVTYAPEVAHRIVDEGLQSIGPINLEALFHYFRSHVVPDDGSDDVQQTNVLIRKQQYDAFVDALCEFAPSGVILSDEVIGFIHYRLSGLYGGHGIE